MILKRFLGISLILASCNNTSSVENLKVLKESKIEAKSPPSKEEHLPKKEDSKTEIKEEKKEENKPSQKSSKSSVGKASKKKSKKKHIKPSSKKKSEILNKLKSAEKDIDVLEDSLKKL